MKVTFCILDCETLGLHPAAPIWEFACVVRYDNGQQEDISFFIEHAPGNWVDTLPREFQDDYRARYDPFKALGEPVAAAVINMCTAGAEVIGCNPGFDMERLAALLRRNNIEPSWHYHPWDIASMALGYICGADRGLPPRPWKSDRLATRIGVFTKDFARHTAMGDVLWTLAQWDVMTGDDSVEPAV